MSAEPKPEKPHVKSSSSSLTKGHDEVGDMMHHGKKPCRSCVDFKSWTKHTKKAQNTVIVEKGQEQQKEVSTRHECPLDINELGRNTWSFLHTMAANYPDKPTNDDQNRVKTFISSFSHLYPCEMCSYDFRKRISKEPVETDNRHNLSQWMCRMHNQINKMLGKETFDCSRVDERWRDGWKDGSCD